MRLRYFQSIGLFLGVVLSVSLAACGGAPTTEAAIPSVTVEQPATETPQAAATSARTDNRTDNRTESPTPTRKPVMVLATTQGAVAPTAETPVASATPRATPSADAWAELPVIPVISDTAIAIYQRGLDLGRDPHAFSKIGDCQNVSSYFLSPFAYASAFNLGPHASLQETIDWYQQTASFTRESLAVKGGFNVAAVLSPLRADPDACQAGESPLACELRVHNPSVAIISMETWWSGQPDAYEKYMRQLLDYTISQGVVPILATKADNLEGENQINKALARLAWEYDIPLWNFWASVQSLPNKGLTQDGFHLTLGNYDYNDPKSTATGWSMRNLTALQALDAVRRGVAP